MLISIIIPVYNCDNYIAECLTSVLSQIDKDSELIIINDGSTDNSLDVILSTISQYNNFNIKILDIENSGLSAARNLGIENASSEYISFLDSDDIWLDGYYKIIKKHCLEDKADIFEYNAIRFVDDTYSGEKLNLTQSRNEFLNENDLIKTFLNTEWYAWSRVYKSTLFNDIKFPVEKRFEDLAIIPLLYLIADKIVSIPDTLVGYRINLMGITQNVKLSDVSDIEEHISHWVKFNDDNCKFYLSLSLLKLSVYLKYLNSVLSPNDFKLTESARKTIRGYISFKAIIYGLKYFPYLYLPRFMFLLSFLKSKITKKRV